jgi:hypothetical protein
MTGAPPPFGTMISYSQGYVGIGTANPSDILHLVKTSGADANNVSALTRFWSGYNDFNQVASYRLKWYSDTWDFGIVRDSSTNSVGCGIYYNASVLTSPFFYVSSSGNVGIGTTGPASILQVSNSVVATSYTSRITMGVSDGPPDVGTTYGMVNLTRPSNVTDNKGHIAFIRNGQSLNMMGYLQNSNTIGWVRGDTMNTTLGIFITSNGLVGIGKTTPSDALDVLGAIRTIGGLLSYTYTGAFGVTSMSISPSDFSPSAAVGWFIAFTYPNSVAAGSSLALVFCTTTGFYVTQSFSGPHTYALTGGALNTPMIISGLNNNPGINYGVTLIQLRNLF